MKLKRSTTVALTVAIAFFMQNLDTTAVNTAIPQMAKSFGTDIVHLSAGITSYMIALAIFIPVSGWIADRFGTRKVFCTSILLFILASILCGSSQTLEQFVVFRIFQGIAGAMMTPVGRLAVLKMTPKEDFVSAMNYITMPALVAPILGPLVGGYLATYWTWHWIFRLNVPISIICIILAWKLLPKDDEAKEGSKHFDLVGFVLSGLGLAGFMIGVEMFSQDGIPFYIPLALMIFSIMLILLNVKYSRHTSRPLIDYSILQIKTYRIAIFVGTITRMVIGVAPYLVPLMFQVGFGLSPFRAGALFVATMAGNLSMKTMTVRMIKRFSFKQILMVNGCFVAFFTLLTAFLTPETPVWMILVVMFLSGMARSMEFTSLTTMAFSDIESSRMTSANSFYSTIQQMSSGMGIAMGAVMLRITNSVNHSEPGVYSVADFKLAFIIIAALSFVHLAGYLQLSNNAGDSVRGIKQ